ncbi:hypothetical protein J437_LFUL018590 [Ladona fulva]|uniref:Uncharacterized protein n=1 Tax=Ladona fulva TaxID=123851 RepID=A0A8K0PA61_LADFU|nr:hypothetical protein J437_LFUL018590 [Ladona fulva]
MVNVGHLLLFKLLFLYCQSQPHSPELKLKNECYMSTVGSNVTTFSRYKTCPKIGDPIELSFKKGNIKGSRIAEFLLDHPLCYQPSYKIELLYVEVRDGNKNCSETSSKNPHSERKFSILTCDGNCTDVCGKYGKVQFFNVVPGCYKAKVLQFRTPNLFKNRETNWIYMGDNDSKTWNVDIDIKDIVHR